MKIENSAVTEYGVAEPYEMASYLREKLRFYTDSWDLSVDLRAAYPRLVVIDARGAEAYRAQHIPGAISFPHRTMSAISTADLDRSKFYVIYCDGIGCNGSTKGAYKLSALGLHAVELLGGLDWWKRDGHPVCSGDAPGDLRGLLNLR
jgi:rhodanese-related sulfurtransferase